MRTADREGIRLPHRIATRMAGLRFGETERGGVNAITEAGGPRAVREQVPEVRVALGAEDLDAFHEK
jgi:hypothetical protein